MKKVFDQTVRDIKREVNKKVLKVPGIEQKVLDATSNESWGPHGSYLADIAQATRNYHEYQMIMGVLWKRINDTGKNWRHVYKALIVLEYLVGNGSERVIDDIREHAYQISTLSDFQYIDSGGRDQGNNVRKKSQSIVALVNDKEKIQEFRQKALANRDKYRGPSPTGGMYRPSPYSSTGGGYGDRYDDDRYEGRYGEDRNGYNREKDWGTRDDDRSSHGGDRYSKDYDERNGRDGYRDDDFKGSRGSDDYGSRNRGYDRERDRPYDDDDRYSSRSAGGRVEEMSPDERRFERKLSQQSIGAPPSYEEAVNGTPSHISDERNGPMAPNASSPPPPNISSLSATSPPAPKASSPPRTTTPAVAAAEVTSSEDKEVETFDEFDPRSSIPAAPSAASAAETDIFGLADINALALIPVPTVATTSEVASASTSGFESNIFLLSSASSVLSQPSENPFGDSPFKALPSDDNFNIQGQSFASLHSNTTASNPSMPTLPTSLPANPETVPNFEFSHTFAGISYGPPSIHGVQAPASTTSPFPPSQSGDDILEGILPQAGVSATTYPAPAPAPAPAYHLNPTSLPPAPVANYGAVTPFGSPAPVSVSSGTFEASHAAPLPATTGQVGPVFSVASPAPIPTPAQSSHLGYTAPLNSQIPPALAASTAPAPSGSYAVAQQQKDKFEPKSAVWADTLSRGLVNLNISGSKINPLADIGVDFDAINRKEKRTQKEKSSANPVTSTITMGKAMGSGSGIGRAGASGIIAQPPNPMMGGGSGMGMAGGRGMGMGMGTGMGMSGGPGMGMGMGGGPGMNMGMGMGTGMGMGMGMGSYGGMNQPMGGMGMGFNMGVGQGAQMRPPSGQGMPGGYNPMLGTGGGYGSQQPYGGYR